MRILFLNYEYPPLGGGAANATKCILEEYAKFSDLKVDLVTSSVDEKYHEDRIGENVKVHRIPIGKNSKNLHFQSQKDLLIYSWKAYFFSKKLIRKNHYDLTHSFFTVPCGCVSLVLKWKFKIPFVVSLRGADVPGYAERFSFIYIFLTPLIKFIWKNSFSVVSNSQGLKELALKAKPDQKIEIIYNGVDTEKFKPVAENKDGEKFIITPGASRLTSRKGLKYLVEATAILFKKYPNIFLEIIGDGNEKEELEKLIESLNIKERVNFSGVVPHDALPVYYQKSSVFVLPSLNEGMSNTMLEALASGLPILATDTGGSKELIIEGKNGYIIKMKNAKDIAEKIEKLIIDSNLREKMGENSRKKALELSWKSVATAYRNIYGNIK